MKFHIAAAIHVAGLLGFQTAFGELVNIAPDAIALPPGLENPINGGKQIIFSGKPSFADRNGNTVFELIGDQPNRFEFHFPGGPVSPRRCEVQTQLQKVRKGHVEVLQDGQWRQVGRLTSGDNPALEWDPVPISGLAVVIEETSNIDHEPMKIAEVRILSDSPWKMASTSPAIELSTKTRDNVFILGEAIKVNCSIKGEWPAKTRLHWQWDDFLNDPVDPGGEMKAPAGSQESISFLPKEQGPVMLKVRLQEETGAVVAESWLLVGVRDPAFPGKVPPLPRPKELPKALASSPPKFFWSAEIYTRMVAPYYSAKDLNFDLFKEAGFDVIGAYQNMPWFEPLPGVYNFKTLDRIVRKAEDAGMLLELGLWRWDFTCTLQTWLTPYRAKERDTAKAGHVYSLAAEPYRKAALDAAEVFIRRYRESAAVGLWYVHPYGEVDHDVTGQMKNGEARLDYSDFVKERYRNFLQEKFATITDLNEAYGSGYAAFEEIDIPISLPVMTPDLADATLVLDNRTSWRDYLNFRDNILSLGLQEDVYKLIRRLDPTRPIAGMSNSMAAESSKAEIDLRRRYGAFYGDQGLELPSLIRRYLPVVEAGLPFRGEPIQPIFPRRVPRNLTPLMGRVFFNAAAVGVKQMNYVFAVWEENPVWEMFAYAPLRKAFEANANAHSFPGEAGLLHSFTTGALEGHTSFQNLELHRWIELLSWSKAIVKPGLWVEPMLVDGRKEGFAGKKLLIDNNSRVLDEIAISQLTTFVEEGGCLVLQRTSGEYENANPSPQYSLLRALGYPNPESLATTFSSEGMAKGEGCLEGMALPLRTISELSKPGSKIAATFEGKTVGVEWDLGKGKVLLIGGVIGDLRGGKIQALNRSGKEKEAHSLMRSWEAELGPVFQDLIRLGLVWANLEPQGVLTASPVDIIARLGDKKLFISIRNPTEELLKDVRLALPQRVAAAKQAVAVFPNRTESLSAADTSGNTWIVPSIEPGEFCLVEIDL